MKDRQVRLRDVVGVADLRLELVTEGGDDRVVRWAHPSELGDPSPYLRGGELLLTAGVGLPDDHAAVLDYVRPLARSGVAALGFGVEPVHRRIPEPLFTACTEVGLPLVRVPSATPFLAVAQAVGMLWENLRTERLRSSGAAQRAMIAAAQRSPDSAAVVRALHRATGAWCALVRVDRSPVTSGRAPHGYAEIVAAASASARSVSTRVGDCYVLSHRAGEDVLVLASAEPFDDADRATMTVAVSVLVLTGSGQVPEQAVRAAITRGVLEDSTDGLRELLPPGPLRAVVGRRRMRHARDLSAVVNSRYVAVEQDRVWALMSGDPDLAAIDNAGWLVGVGAVTELVTTGEPSAERILLTGKENGPVPRPSNDVEDTAYISW